MIIAIGKPGKLCFAVFSWPRTGFDLPRFKNKVGKAYLLIDPERQAIPMTTGADGTIRGCEIIEIRPRRGQSK